jgi:hypothetical protein
VANVNGRAPVELATPEGQPHEAEARAAAVEQAEVAV